MSPEERRRAASPARAVSVAKPNGNLPAASRESLNHTKVIGSQHRGVDSIGLIDAPNVLFS
nr:hypothetical protein SHINE37_110238 [Rhizobiaceae bacterium]